MMNKKFTACLMAVLSVGATAAPVTSVHFETAVIAAAETAGDLVYEKTDGGLMVTSCKVNSGAVEIPADVNGQKVVGIGSGAFYQHDGITSVKIPDTVIFIGDSAFMDCTSLDTVVFGRSVESIDMCAFSGCISIKYLEFPDSLKDVGESSFSDCTALTSLKVPDKDIAYGSEAFLGCTSLKSVRFPLSEKSIGAHAFGFSVSDDENAEYQKISGFRIRCFMNSPAYVYAVENGIGFSILDPDTPDTTYDTPVPDDDTVNYDSIPGDVNGDGRVNISDVTAAAMHVKNIKQLDSISLSRSDVNGDSHVNITDILMLASHVKGIKAL